MTQPRDDHRYMRLALSLARRGLGRVWPNPAVGCVIVQAGRIVGRGRTADGGRPHAETIALEQAGKAAQGATAYVTLEPCAHQGETPSCAAALIEAGIAQVVSALEDPDTRVAGKGHAMLRDAGIEVLTGVEAQAAERLNAGFLLHRTKGRPFVTLKLASSFDGRIAMASGESRWITGAPARRLVHAMRARHDAVMVGGGTARSDDPTLLIRDLGISRQPVRVICARLLDLPISGRLAKSASTAPLWLCHSKDADPALLRVWGDLGARLIPCDARAGQLDPSAILQALAAEGLTRVFCEGGGVFAASLLRAGLVDELAGFTAGLAIGADGLPSLGAMGISRLDAAPRFELLESRAVGGDIMHHWAVR